MGNSEPITNTHPSDINAQTQKAAESLSQHHLKGSLKDSTMNDSKPIPAADMEKTENISLADPALLEKIDKLFELNVGKDVAPTPGEALTRARPNQIADRSFYTF